MWRSLCLSLTITTALTAQEWPTFAGDPAGTRYSPLKQIDASNIAKLKPAWVYHTGDKGDRNRTTIECTPVVRNGVMYVTSPAQKAIALNAATGEKLWSFDPFADGKDRSRNVNRGVAYWTDGKQSRILYAANSRLYALDAKTGTPFPDFGDHGSIDLTTELDRDSPGAFNGMTSPGVVYKNLIILGSSVGEGPRPSAPGHLRAYDVKTGKRVWIFHTIPHPGEFGYETWPKDAWKTAGGVNAWGGLALDESRGVVYTGLGSPAFDFYGGDRIGDNLFGDSIIALDANTGKRIWHFQTVHHDIWDYDLPTHPVLARVQGKDAVIQSTKTGFIFVLDRDTGKPLFPVEERQVPASDIPGEKTSRTQPFPMKPPAFSAQTFEPTNISPEAKAGIERKIKEYRSGLFQPPSLQGSIALPGTLGGALWGGIAYDEQSGMAFVNTSTVASLLQLVASKPGTPYPYEIAGYGKIRDEEGYTAAKPPWGLLSAIDLNKGTIAWQIILGEHAALKARGVPKTGTENMGGPVVTASGLLFIAATQDEMIRAFETKTGKQLWEAKLEAGGYATPATYMAAGKQFVVIAAGGGGKLMTNSGDAFIAFALP
jgi:quinoprotein glucose dehydrogenase